MGDSLGQNQGWVARLRRATQLIEVPNPNPAQRIFGNLRQPPLSSLIDQGKAASSVLFSKDDLGEFRKGLQHWAQVFNHPLSV